MSEPILRETLLQVRDEVVVPAIDYTEFASRTRRMRRRRRGLQAAVGGGVLAATLVGGLVLQGLVTEPTTQIATSLPAAGTPVVLDGRIQLVQSDGSLIRTARLGTPVGILDEEVVSLHEGVLSGPGDTQTSGVSAAFTSVAGLTYQSTDGTIHLPDGRTAVADGVLVAAGDNAYVTEQDGVLTVHTANASHELQTGSDGSHPVATAVEVGDGTIMVAAGNTVSFYETDGHRLGGFLGGVTGALSPDGDSYAYAASTADRTGGMRPGLVTYDVRTDQLSRLPIDGDAVDLAWVRNELVVLTDQGGTRTLLQCDASSCRTLLTDAAGGLSLR